MDKILSPEYGLIFWTSLSFFIVLFILWKYAWTPDINGSG